MDDFRPLENLSYIFDCVADGVYAVDLEGRITFFNAAAEVITHYLARDVLGHTCEETFRSPDCGKNCPREESRMTGKSIVSRPHDIFSKEAQNIPISLSVAPIFDEDVGLRGWVHSFRSLFPSERPCPDFLPANHSFEGIISRNEGMRRLFSTLPDLAASDATILIRGESGSGKELFAKALHNLSPRNSGPMVTVNCGALPEHLLEAEIFGVRRGAYTGAAESRPGRLEMAEKGTLFLDEIGDMPLPLQVKLLRVLENREYQPLGADQPRKADVRFVAATNKNLEALVEQGLFRRDLFYRLCVLCIEIPPLRDRKEDIPLLGTFFLSEFNKRLGKSIEGVAPRCCALIQSHDFPGNVRELHNLLEHGAIMCSGRQLEITDLPQEFRDKVEQHERKGGRRPSGEDILNLLAKHHGNKSEVAQELGIDRTTLWRWMKKKNLYFE